MSTSILHSRRPFSASRRSIRPALERLDDRIVPSTFTVTNTFDSGTGSLRAAVQQANLNPGGDTINFSATLVGPITLTTGQIDITDDLTISNANPNVSVSGNGTSRLFETHNVNVSISGLTMANGNATGSSLTPGSGGDGGAIQQDGGVLNLTGDRFLNNKASNRGGAVFNFYGTLNGLANQFSGNQALWGGAVYNSGTMTDMGGVYIGNSAQSEGGAIDNASSVIALQGVKATLTGDIFVSNTAGYSGGAIQTENGSQLTVNGGFETANHAGSYGGALSVDARFAPGTKASVTGVTYQGNSAGVAGGAIASNSILSVSTSTFQFNTALSGGAIWAKLGSTSLTANTLLGNSQPDVVQV